LCVEKELKVRIKELFKYREHGLTKASQLVPFEQLRFRSANSILLLQEPILRPRVKTPAL
jgi:hypothetical protein